MSPDYVDRRVNCLRVSCERVGDFDYFERLGKATDTYGGWSNWFHRHIINKHDEFKDVKIVAMAKKIPDNELRRLILKKRMGAFEMFWKEFIFDNPIYNDKSADDAVSTSERMRLLGTLGEWDTKAPDTTAGVPMLFFRSNDMESFYDSISFGIDLEEDGRHSA